MRSRTSWQATTRVPRSAIDQQRGTIVDAHAPNSANRMVVSFWWVGCSRTVAAMKEGRLQIKDTIDDRHIGDGAHQRDDDEGSSPARVALTAATRRSQPGSGGTAVECCSHQAHGALTGGSSHAVFERCDLVGLGQLSAQPRFEG